jgi:hypothetical protein
VAVLKNRSAAGLSALSFELEAWGLLVHTTYGALAGLPFNAYGCVQCSPAECSVAFACRFLLIQNALLQRTCTNS